MPRYFSNFSSQAHPPMIPEFEKLNDEEIELMLKAPILVCILIAGADGNIDRKEIKQAIAVAQKQKKGNASLAGYFNELSQDFEDKIKMLIQSFPYESTQRAPLVMEELAQVNALWVKIDPTFALDFYEMLLALAEKIATSSGGLWGMKTVGAEEAKYMKLPMLTNPSKK
jgi:hypothetical protein